MSHIAIFDIGKTNKKCFVFDESYRIIFEKSETLPETSDEDGYSCENLGLLNEWLLGTCSQVLDDPRFDIRALNCTAYGASFVHLDAEGRPLTPLYNYLKPFPEDLKRQFLEAHGGEESTTVETCSPMLGHLNSGLQLYWLKHHKPLIFNSIKHSLHLPQYLSYLLASSHLDPDDVEGRHRCAAADLSSIGCHTMLWHFEQQHYASWVMEEGIVEKFPAIGRFDTVLPGSPLVGIGLHDSSAALIPYLASQLFEGQPFLLISTGTWCISLNPFIQPQDWPLKAEELAQDCLCYLSYKGEFVKAARYFGGHEHEQAAKKMAADFGVADDFYRNLRAQPNPVQEAYSAFMRQLVEKQAASARLAMGSTPLRHLLVDGGFSKNETYMGLLAEAFPGMEVFAAEVPHATALGAAVAMHGVWNGQALPQNLVLLKKYTA